MIEAKIWYVYICLRGGQLYTGITTNLNHRMKQHHANLFTLRLLKINMWQLEENGK